MKNKWTNEVYEALTAYDFIPGLLTNQDSSKFLFSDFQMRLGIWSSKQTQFNIQ